MKSNTSPKKTKYIKQAKKLSWRYILTVVLSIALIGGAMVYVTNAGSAVTFTRYSKEMTGGYKDKLYANGTRSATSPILAAVTMKEFLYSKSICIHYGVEVPSPTNGLGFRVEILDTNGQATPLIKQFSISGKPKGYTDNACMKLSIVDKNSNSYEMGQAGTVKIVMAGRGGVLIDKIEGRK